MRGRYISAKTDLEVLHLMTRNPEIYRARRLRQQANAPEDIAWQALRQLRGHGYSVRRQHPIGGFVVDFAIERAKLVIEIDGGIHNLEAIRLADRARQREIEAMGWKVIRVDAETAMSGDHILAVACEALGI